MRLTDGTNIISVIVKPNSKKETVDFLSGGAIKLSIKERPVDNAANEAVIKKIAEIFNKPKK